MLLADYPIFEQCESSFLTTLPLEIRQRIYGYALAHERPLSLLDIHIDKYYQAQLKETVSGIILACKQTYLESGNILWEVNTVKISLLGDYSHDSQRAIVDKYAHAFRSVTIELLPGMFLGHFSKLRRQIRWLQQVLDDARGLKELQIVVVPPCSPDRSSDAALRCFAQLRYSGRVDIVNYDRRHNKYGRVIPGISAACIADVKRAINGPDRHGKAKADEA